ncbi:MAG: hypothetical protein GVY35_12800 [Bacteroidetes bacterium]|jgi:hypothetical protein|nr:hypothetical protein [Phycisphaerae bacterium]NBB74542.1 hypothetical protein [Bacteroidota bacterium]
MTTSEKIQRQVEQLPESLQQQVLRFAESLADGRADLDWREVSLASAMRGMEEESPLYSTTDVKERF